MDLRTVAGQEPLRTTSHAEWTCSTGALADVCCKFNQPVWRSLHLNALCAVVLADNTRWARHLLPTLFPLSEDGGQQHLLVTVWFGANDAAAPSEVTHVPLAEFRDNLREILRHLCKVSTHVVVLTPPPIHGPTRLEFQSRKYGASASGVLERTTESASQYAAATREVAGELELPVFDAHLLMLAEAEWPRLVGRDSHGDGLHLVSAGQRFIGAGLVSFVAKVLDIPIDAHATPQECS